MPQAVATDAKNNHAQAGPSRPRTANAPCGQAIVTLTDALTKRRKDYWLGAYGSPESRELHHRLLALWESSGRRLPDASWLVLVH